MSGARLDLGEATVALSELEIPQLDPKTAFSYSPELFEAYAEVLQDLGREEEAEQWHERAARADAALASSVDLDETIEIIEIDEDDDIEPDSMIEPVEIPGIDKLDHRDAVDEQDPEQDAAPAPKA